MKSSLLLAALVAIASSLTTIGVFELLRTEPSTHRTQPLAASPSSPAPAPEAAPVVLQTPSPSPPVEDSGLDERLIALEQRIAALESSSTARTPVVTDDGDLPARDDLRMLVLDWVAEEREVRSQLEELKWEQELLREIEFDARYQAMEFAKEHDLPKWQEDEFAKLFLETGLRAEEIESGMDMLTGDPAEYEARWEEFDEWVDQRERELTERLNPDLYEELYGEEDEDSDEDV